MGVRELSNATPYVAFNRVMAAMNELLTASRQSWVFRDRLEGSLTGLLVGDALGLSHECQRGSPITREAPTRKLLGLCRGIRLFVLDYDDPK